MGTQLQNTTVDLGSAFWRFPVPVQMALHDMCSDLAPWHWVQAVNRLSLNQR